MRLIDVHTLTLKDVPWPAPPYAILSHTWGSNEVSYQDFQDEATRATRAGFEKIRATCEQAKRDELEYAWVDTCCIDKTSSAELTEAINSMFKWYREAANCYAYLSDVPDGDNPLSPADSKFGRSLWFTRGWTLQELIAPARVEFYSAGWTLIGEKAELTEVIEDITDISVDILRGGDMASVSVAQRMSWAAHRRTTREEDIAYCLMGIFDVNMPMLYGEGRKAFVRLQEEILRESEDQSLFAWRATDDAAAAAPFRGLLASSPDEYAGCGGIVPFRNLSSGDVPTSLTSRGIPLTSAIERDPTSDGHSARIGLNCRWGNDFENIISIDITSEGGDQFVRSRPSELFSCSSYGQQETVYVRKSIHSAKVQRAPELERQNAVYISNLPPGISVVDVSPPYAQYSPKLRLLHLGPWIHEKAVIEMEVAGTNEGLLVCVWVVPAKEGRGYECYFMTKIAPVGGGTKSLAAMGGVSNAISAGISTVTELQRPKDLVSSRTVSLGSNKLVVVTIKPGKVQGFDMFCMEVSVHRNNSAGRRIRSIYGASRV